VSRPSNIEASAEIRLPFLKEWRLTQPPTMSKDSFWTSVAATIVGGVGLLAIERATENKTPTPSPINIYIIEKRQAAGPGNPGLFRKPEGGEPPQIPAKISRYSAAGITEESVVMYSNQYSDLFVTAMAPDSVEVSTTPKIEAEIRTPSGDRLINYITQDSLKTVWQEYAVTRNIESDDPVGVYKIMIDMYDDPKNPRPVPVPTPVPARPTK
jgi:hypothetical protein